VGRSVKVHKNGKVVDRKASNKIYHHKWLFVRDTYPGFNVKASVARANGWRSTTCSFNGFKRASTGTNTWSHELPSSD
jgi:hypothetical protein